MLPKQLLTLILCWQNDSIARRSKQQLVGETTVNLYMLVLNCLQFPTFCLPTATCIFTDQSLNGIPYLVPVL